uniref:50S ribosomal protein L14 n=1 Tax=Nephromyces sp. ex Molgula occidentalis TaxID=2544991 RepID=A0A5C1H8D6_9APIC|nr:50S ribosomal protein L14 [Nephromyces sp. ex Molgula occidentalis]
MMVQIGTIFNIIDNTGVKKILCIGILNSKSKVIKIGDIIIGVVKQANKSKYFKKSAIIKALIIRLKIPLNLKTGFSYKFNDNSAILIDKHKNPIGTRIFGPIPKYFKDKNYLKLITLTNEFIE